jgi:hypothetical protein
VDLPEPDYDHMPSNIIKMYSPLVMEWLKPIMQHFKNITRTFFFTGASHESF